MKDAVPCSRTANHNGSSLLLPLPLGVRTMTVLEESHRTGSRLSRKVVGRLDEEHTGFAGGLVDE